MGSGDLVGTHPPGTAGRLVVQCFPASPHVVSGGLRSTEVSEATSGDLRPSSAQLCLRKGREGQGASPTLIREVITTDGDLPSASNGQAGSSTPEAAHRTLGTVWDEFPLVRRGPLDVGDGWDKAVNHGP